MIRPRLQMLQHLRIDPSVAGCCGDKPLEALGRHSARARVGHQQAARCQQLQAEAVDVAVGATGPLSMGARRRELGRVEDDEIELLAGRLEFA